MDLSEECLRQSDLGDSPQLENHLASSSTDDFDDDEFADFVQAPDSLTSETINSSRESAALEDGNSRLEEEEANGDEVDDDFADFQTFAERTSSEAAAAAASDTIQSGSKSKLELVIADSFPLAQEECPPSTTISSDLHSDAGASSSTIWSNLQNLEEARCLKLKWPASHSFQAFLGSLNIDYRNILQTRRMPPIGLLEPTKCLQPTSYNPDNASKPSGSRPLTGGSELDQSSPSKIPPVDFDWLSSGLVNPLNGNGSSKLDLGFLVNEDKNKEENKSNNTIAKLEEELLTPEPSRKAGPGDGKKSDAIQELLSKVKYSPSVPSFEKRPENLSSEAAHVLDELPILSFIRAKVLMFPVNEPYSN